MTRALGGRLRSVLPPETARAWTTLRVILPPSMMLFGGTAIAAHLHHRVSRDLDFFFDDDVDLAVLRSRLEGTGPTAVTHLDEDTLNCVFGATRVQFLRIRHQTNLEPAVRLEDVAIASLRDLLATKLKVIADRGELRDYFDIQAIEQRTPLTVESGLADYQARYGDSNSNNLITIVRALGYLDDVVDDPGLPVARGAIEDYWRDRQADLLRALDSTGNVRARPRAARTKNGDASSTPAGAPPVPRQGAIWVPPHVRNGRPVRGYWRRG